MPDPHSNFGYSTVLTAPSPASSGTSLVVQAADGVKFPTGGSFNATVWPVSAQPTTANAEIVRVTAISTDTFTITRAQESTSARTIVVGDQIAATVTAKTLTDVEFDRSYLTSVDQLVPANTQVIFDDYLELAASFVYEVAAGAELVVGSYATPLPLPDQNANIFITVADETIPMFREIIFSDFYEISAPFATEVAGGALLQVGTGSSLFPPGYEYDYVPLTTTITVSGTSGAETTVITGNAVIFDGATTIYIEFFAPQITTGATDFVNLEVFDGATSIGIVARVSAAGLTSEVEVLPVHTRVRFTPSNGQHIFTTKAYRSTNNGSIVCGPGGTNTQVAGFQRVIQA